MYTSTSMDEKTLVEYDNQQEVQQQQGQIIIASLLPPSYDLHTPPPPTYLQSTTRLYYKNQPYISDLDQLAYRQEQEERQLRRENESDSWAEIARLPLHRRFNYYMASWGNTVYDGRLIFFSFFIFASFTIMAIVVSVIVILSLLLKH